jgi:hypothetical protein
VLKATASCRLQFIASQVTCRTGQPLPVLNGNRPTFSTRPGNVLYTGVARSSHSLVHSCKTLSLAGLRSSRLCRSVAQCRRNPSCVAGRKRPSHCLHHPSGFSPIGSIVSQIAILLDAKALRRRSVALRLKRVRRAHPRDRPGRLSRFRDSNLVADVTSSVVAPMNARALQIERKIRQAD